MVQQRNHAILKFMALSVVFSFSTNTSENRTNKAFVFLSSENSLFKMDFNHHDFNFNTSAKRSIQSNLNKVSYEDIFQEHKKQRKDLVCLCHTKNNIQMVLRTVRFN